jgi:hypothetical protein
VDVTLKLRKAPRNFNSKLLYLVDHDTQGLVQRAVQAQRDVGTNLVGLDGVAIQYVGMQVTVISLQVLCRTGRSVLPGGFDTRKKGPMWTFTSWISGTACLISLRDYLLVHDSSV